MGLTYDDFSALNIAGVLFCKNHVTAVIVMQ